MNDIVYLVTTWPWGMEDGPDIVAITEDEDLARVAAARVQTGGKPWHEYGVDPNSDEIACWTNAKAREDDPDGEDTMHWYVQIETFPFTRKQP